VLRLRGKIDTKLKYEAASRLCKSNTRMSSFSKELSRSSLSCFGELTEPDNNSLIKAKGEGNQVPWGPEKGDGGWSERNLSDHIAGASEEFHSKESP
jgi:hypothetical protein